MLNVFLNSFGRLRSGWRFTFAIILFLFLLVALDGLFLQINRTTNSSVFLTIGGYVASRLIVIAVLVAAGWLCGKLLEGLPFATLGCDFRGRWHLDFLLGSLLGILTLGFAVLIAALGGGLRLVFNETASAERILLTLVVTLLLFVPAAAYEELLARSYPLQTLARARLGWLGVLLTSTLFSLLHLGNPNVSPYFTFLNTLLAGVWLAVAYLKVRNLWLPLGLHWAWNWAMVALFGLPVSGLTEFGGARPEPLLRGVDAGPAWLTGGGYGIEGGAACTIAVLLSIFVVWRAPFFRPDAELLALTSRENPKKPAEPVKLSLS